MVIINVTRTHAHTNNADSFGCPLCFCLYLPCSSFMHDWSARFFWESGACPCTFSQTVFELVYGGQCPRKRGGFYFFFFNYYRSDVSVSFASGVLCALSPLARFPSFVLCPAWYAGCFGARGVGRAHLARSAVLSPREDVCYRVSPFVFASCFYTRTQMQKVCPTHAKCGCSIIFRLCLTNLALIVYPYYTLTSTKRLFFCSVR